MQPLTQLALPGHTGAGQLRHAVVVGDEDIEAAFNLCAHGIGAALGAEQAQAQLVGAHGKTGFPHHFAQVKGVGGGCHQAGYAEIAEHHQLLIGVA